MNISRGAELLTNNDSLTQEEINEILNNNIMINAQKSATNVALVERVHTIANANEREVMEPLEFRKSMNLQYAKGQYGRIA